MVVEIPVTQARAELAELVNRVVYAGERVVLTRHGRPVAALVSAADLQRIDGTPPGQTATAPGAGNDDRRQPSDVRPPLRIAAQHQPPEAPSQPRDRGAGPWL